MTEITLTGLQGHNPLAAMAAWGVLRIVQRTDPTVSLHWMTDRYGVQDLAVLTTEALPDHKALLDVLQDYAQARLNSPELVYTDSIPKDLSEYRVYADRVIRDNPPGERDPLDFLAALTHEATVRPNQRLVPTPFFMLAGNQKLMVSIRKLLTQFLGVSGSERKRRQGRERLREALYGPWRYQDKTSSLGWDPETVQIAAYMAEEPTKKGAFCVAGAVWLAFEALPFFPVVSDGQYRRVPGWNRQGTRFSWPIWRFPLQADTVRTLLSMPELAEDTLSDHIMRARGIERVYRARTFRSGKYLSFSRAMPYWSANLQRGHTAWGDRAA